MSDNAPEFHPTESRDKSRETHRASIRPDAILISEERIWDALTWRHIELDLSDLNLTELPNSLRRCKWLKSLNLSGNLLTKIPVDFWGLSQLVSLKASANRLRELPDSFGSLPKLTHLTIAENQLETIPTSLVKCENLTSIDLSRNNLKFIPSELADLSYLQELVVSHNPLRSLPDWLGKLSRLEVLEAINCDLVSIPHELQFLNQLDRLYLQDNPLLRIPDEILGPNRRNETQELPSATASDILNYNFSLNSTFKPRPLNEVKLLLVGRGKSGKSSLRDRLVYDTFDEQKPETPGIDIQPWVILQNEEKLRIHVWDFAGQEITHATHQFFLTERSVYVLVLEGRSDNQDRDAEYWLRLISIFGKDSPVIVALNQWDEQRFDVDRNDLSQRYPAIRGFIRTDCKTRRGISDLQESLSDILHQFSEVRQLFPGPWWSVKEYFGTSSQNYIRFSQYRSLCDERGLRDVNEQDSLARILHALGIILHYGEDARLKDTTVLNPQWVTSGVYRLLRFIDGTKSGGTLTLSDARKALPEEPESMVRYLIELMRRFDLCYALDDSDTRWLMPQVLTKYQPELPIYWQDTTTSLSSRLRYLYKVIPEGLLPRFIVRTHPLSESRERWRNGVVLAYETAFALVKAEPSENRIAVIVRGPDADRLRLTQLIRGHLQDIHKSIPGLDPLEQMEIPSHPGVYEDVQLLEQDEQSHAITTIRTAKGSVRIEQTPQLDTISAGVMRRDPGPAPLRIFVSYSQRDIRHLDIFKQNLKVMQMNGLITVWHDGLIKTGSEWDQDIRRELEDADIIVFMVSTNFLASDYIRGVEMARAIQRKEAGEAELVILLLEPDCGWKTTHQLKLRGTDQTITCNLKKYQVIHPRNKKATRWPTTANAFNHVEPALTELRRTILAKRPVGEFIPRHRPAG